MRTLTLGFALALSIAAAGCSGGDDPTAPPPPGGTTLWGRRFGKSTDIEPVVLAVSGAGDVIVGGRFFATVDFGSGPVTSPANNWQAFVAKYDGEGNVIWAHSLGDIFEEQVTKVAVDSAGDVYVAGTFRGTIDFGGNPLESEALSADLFVAKLSPDGSPLWSKRYGAGGFDQLQGMAVDAQGGVALFGTVGNGTDFGAGPTTFDDRPFLARLDPSGAATYAAPFESPGSVEAYLNAFGLDSAGAIVVSVTYYQDYGDGGVYVAKLGPTGEPAWVRDFSSIGNTTAVTGLSVGANDAIFLTGSLTGFVDFGGGVTSSGDSDYGDTFVAALAPDGAPRWIHRFAPQRGRVDDLGNTLPAALSANAIAAVEDGVVLTGSFVGGVDFGGGARQSAGETGGLYYTYADDVFAVRLDAGGLYLWDTTFGNASSQAGTSVGANPSGDVFIAGSANGGLPFGDGELVNTSYYDAFLVKLAR